MSAFQILSDIGLLDCVLRLRANIGQNPIRVYTIYAPAHHKPGNVQATAMVAKVDKDNEPASWSVQPKHTPDKHS